MAPRISDEDIGINDPNIAYEVTSTEDSVRLVMTFQDVEHPERAARVAVEMAPNEALKIAADLMVAAKHGNLACQIVENGGPYQIVDECVHIGRKELEALKKGQ